MRVGWLGAPLGRRHSGRSRQPRPGEPVLLNPRSRGYHGVHILHHETMTGGQVREEMVGHRAPGCHRRWPQGSGQQLGCCAGGIPRAGDESRAGGPRVVWQGCVGRQPASVARVTLQLSARQRTLPTRSESGTPARVLDSRVSSVPGIMSKRTQLLDISGQQTTENLGGVHRHQASSDRTCGTCPPCTCLQGDRAATGPRQGGTW